jgi:hypothetical protein
LWSSKLSDDKEGDWRGLFESAVVLYCYLSGQTEENHKQLQSGMMKAAYKYEPVTS